MASNTDFVITLSFNKNSEGRVTLAFTLGVAAVDKGLKTTIVLLVDGAHIARKGYADDIDIGEPFLPVKDLLEVYLEHGGEIAVCGSCWRFNHIADDERMQQVKMITAGDVVDLLMNARSSVQLN
jgi:tRNA 2-thiouridine synthesizing protein D